MEVARGEFRTVRWMLEDFPPEWSQHRRSLVGTMRTGVVMHQQHPISEEACSLPANGGTKFRQDPAVGGRRNGVVTLLEFGKQCALTIPEHRQHEFPGRWCRLKLLVRRGRRIFPLHGGTLRLGLIMVHTKLITPSNTR